MKKEPYVGVVGPSEASEHERALAYAVGRRVARIGGVVVCGGLGGVMEAAARGACEADPPGQTVGILPGTDRSAGNPYLTVAVATGLGELRNGVLVRSCDGVVAVGGSAGTLIEMAYALRAGLPVAVLHGWTIVDSVGDLVVGFIVAATAEEAVRAVIGAE